MKKVSTEAPPGDRVGQKSARGKRVRAVPHGGASGAAPSPAARAASAVARTAETAAERERTDNPSEDASLDMEALDVRMGLVTLSRAPAGTLVLVAVDGSNLPLTVSPEAGGAQGSSSRKWTHGLQAQTALAMTTEGVPLGVLAQVYWTRTAVAKRRKRSERLRASEKETGKWMDMLYAAEARACDADMDGRLWFQCGRSYDSWTVMDWMGQTANRVTVRGEHDRALWEEPVRRRRARAAEVPRVREALERTKPIGEIDVELATATGPESRTARLEVRVAKLTLRLSNPAKRKTARGEDGKHRKVEVTWPRALTAVQVREVGSCPVGENPLHWLLWTNFAVRSLAAAAVVVRNHALLYQIVEFDRIWKTWAMDFELMRLRGLSRAERVARLGAVSAERLLALTHLARITPAAAATGVLAPEELAVLAELAPGARDTASSPADAASTATLAPRARDTALPGERRGTIAWALAAIARLGGYTGASPGAPPDASMLTRGYRRLQDALRAYPIEARPDRLAVTPQATRAPAFPAGNGRRTRAAKGP